MISSQRPWPLDHEAGRDTWFVKFHGCPHELDKCFYGLTFVTWLDGSRAVWNVMWQVHWPTEKRWSTAGRKASFKAEP